MTVVARAAKFLQAAVVLACACYIVSVLPGVRHSPGYSQVWEVGFANVVSLGSASLVALRALTDRRRRLAWSLLAVGLGSYGMGALYFSLLLQPLAQMPFPSVADGLWLVFYPTAFAAVLLLAKAELQHRPAGGRGVTPLDGLIVGLTLASLSASFAFDRITAGATGTPIAIATNFAYPIGDLVVLVLVVTVLAVLGRSADRQWWLLGIGVASFAIADTWYLLQVVGETYRAGSLVDATWGVGQVLIGLAAWSRTTKSAVPKDSGMSAVLVPALAGTAAVSVLVAGAFTSLSPVGTLLASAALVVVFVRLALALRQAPFLAESRRQARTDELTGLPNRRAFYELLSSVVSESATSAASTSTVLLLDLDRFKEVNDALGHRTGDDLLREVARRLQAALGPQLPVARLGGDEFALLVPGSALAAHAVAEDVLAAVRAPYDLGLITLQIDGSIGLAEVDPNAESGRTLARADVAMYRAKGQRSGIHIYVDQVDGDSWDRLSMVEALRVGISCGELELDYQPLVNLATNQACSLEALVRWRHPQRGRIAPDDFLPMAERTGLMHDVTRAVLALALDHAVALRDRGVGVPIAINLSASDLLDATVAAAVIDGLRARQLPPECLQIEITETLLMGDQEQTRMLLETLRAHGIVLAVDDYGTGYSSLAYLHDLPVQKLKIDRAFTGRLLKDERTATIVRSTIRLAHDLGLEVVAEGVETQDQADWLADAGADTAQGWLVARAMPGEASLDWLSAPRESLLCRKAVPE